MTTTATAQEWRPTYLDPGYEVSDQGQVRNVRTGRELKAGTAGGFPYHEIRVRVDGKRTKLRVHRAVCWAFHGPPPSAAHVAAHKNGDYLDNRAENLRWATQAENFADAVSHGRDTIPNWRGDRWLNGKLTRADVAAIRELYAAGGTLQREIAERFGISAPHVSMIVNSRRWPEPVAA